MTDNNQMTARKLGIRDLLKTDQVKERFQSVLDKSAPNFIASILAAVNSDRSLDECEPYSIITAALIAATLRLPIERNLGQAWLIPYKSKDGTKARFQMGWRGYVQLAYRTAFYSALNATPIYQGEKVIVNRLTGNVVLTGEPDEPKEITGYLAYFKLVNGFEKALYMSVSEMIQHMKQYSKSWEKRDSAWVTHPAEMGNKTVLTALLRKWGLLSIEMQYSLSHEAKELPDGNGNAILAGGKTFDYNPAEETIDDVESAPSAVNGDAGEALPMAGVMPPGMLAIPLTSQPPPEPDNQQSTIITALLQADVVQNLFNATAVMKLLEIKLTDDPAEAVKKARLYRGWRDTGKPPAEAARLTMSGEVP